MSEACPRHGWIMKRNRCAECGHRLYDVEIIDGKRVVFSPPKATRKKPPWQWPGELIGRWKARRSIRG